MSSRTRMRWLAAAAALGIFTALAGSAGAIVGGDPDGGAHPYVGAAIQSDDTGFQLCSGSLVSATVFLTAAHCFADGSTVSLSFDEDATPGSGAVTFDGTVHDDPAFCLPCGHGLPGFDANDLAVVVLDGAGAPQARYAELPEVGLADTLKHGQVDVVGYGVQSFAGKQPDAFGTRQVATTKVNGGGAMKDEFIKLLASPGICFGDSGGPNLLHGTDTIVAVTSFLSRNPHCNGVSYSERLDRPDALAFVVSFLP
jgi:hypothetical protein